MPYYIAPYVGSGTLTDSFRPRGSDQPGWSAIDLRPDGGATLGGGGLNASFLYLPTANPDPQLMLVAQAPADPMGALLKQALVTRLNLLTTPISTRWDDLAMEILLGPPPGGWQALRATVDRAYEVWLGGLLKQLPVISGGVSISENWNCADSASLTCQLTWTQFSGTSGEILGQQCHHLAATGDDTFARAETDLNSDAHQTQATRSAWVYNAGALANGLLCRKDSTATLTFYTWYGGNDGIGGVNHPLKKAVSGVFTQLALDTTAPAAGQVLKMDANGSTISGYIGGVQKVSVTDTAITGNLRCGVYVGFSNDAGNNARLDDWSAADLAAGGSDDLGNPIFRSRMREW